MTLRSRLVVLVTAIIGVLFATSFIMVSEQRQALVRSLEESLQEASKEVYQVAQFALQATPVATSDSESVTVEVDLDGAQIGATFLPLSDVIVSVVFSDGSTFDITQGNNKSGHPSLQGIDFSAIDQAEFMTTRSEVSEEQIRILISPVSTSSWIVASRSLSQTEEEVAGFALRIFIAVTAISALLLILTLWVFRLGLRPIELVTDAANSIISGSGSEKVPRSSPGTEADRLSQAFNRMVDQRNKAEATLRQFVADASHELRTPLTSFEGLLELAQRSEVTLETSNEILHRLRQESKRMRELVENLLLLANLDEGQLITTDRVDIQLLAEGVVSDISVLHPERKIEYILESEVAGPNATDSQSYIVEGNELMIHQVLAGLLGNALTHTPSTAEIKVIVASQGDQVTLAVEDTGPGIDETMIDSIFERFVRGDQSRSRTENHGGFGLGLPIARSIVESLGGTLTLESTLGKGSTFRISLPSSITDKNLHTSQKSDGKPPVFL